MKRLSLLLIFTSATVLASQDGRSSSIPEKRENGDQQVDGRPPVSATEEAVSEKALGLNPWAAHAAVEEGRRRWILPFFQCRTDFLEELEGAGPGVTRAASRALEGARDFLGKAAQALYATLPATPSMADPEVAAIQDSLDRRQRFPASDVMEERLHRLRRGPVPLAEAEAARVLDRYRSLLPRLWAAFRRRLVWGSVAISRAGKDLLKSYSNCVHAELDRTYFGDPSSELSDDDD